MPHVLLGLYGKVFFLVSCSGKIPSSICVSISNSESTKIWNKINLKELRMVFLKTHQHIKVMCPRCDLPRNCLQNCLHRNCLVSLSQSVVFFFLSLNGSTQTASTALSCQLFFPKENMRLLSSIYVVQCL